jgi:3-oxoacyl-[acyl-carrier protein] reductase
MQFRYGLNSQERPLPWNEIKTARSPWCWAARAASARRSWSGWPGTARGWPSPTPRRRRGPRRCGRGSRARAEPPPAFQADSADAGQIKAAIDQTLARFGRLDILVVNAGVLKLASVDQMSLDDFDRMVAVNVRGVFAAIHHAAPHLADGGRIITIGSNSAGRVGFPGGGAYAMTKAAVATLVRGAAIDLAPRAITVNNIQPGPTVTDMTDGLADLVKPLIPLGRMGETREIAGLAAYLVREESGFMTGASLTIDGGYVA